MIRYPDSNSRPRCGELSFGGELNFLHGPSRLKLISSTIRSINYANSVADFPQPNWNQVSLCHPQPRSNLLYRESVCISILVQWSCTNCAILLLPLHGTLIHALLVQESRNLHPLDTRNPKKQKSSSPHRLMEKSETVIPSDFISSCLHPKGSSIPPSVETLDDKALFFGTSICEGAQKDEWVVTQFNFSVKTHEVNQVHPFS